jgi:hypothetical protein
MVETVQDVVMFIGIGSVELSQHPGHLGVPAWWRAGVAGSLPGHQLGVAGERILDELLSHGTVFAPPHTEVVFAVKVEEVIRARASAGLGSPLWQWCVHQYPLAPRRGRQDAESGHCTGTHAPQRPTSVTEAVGVTPTPGVY